MERVHLEINKKKNFRAPSFNTDSVGQKLKKKKVCICLSRSVGEGVALSLNSLQPVTSGLGAVVEPLQLS